MTGKSENDKGWSEVVVFTSAFDMLNDGFSSNAATAPAAIPVFTDRNPLNASANSIQINKMQSHELKGEEEGGGKEEHDKIIQTPAGRHIFSLEPERPAIRSLKFPFDLKPDQIKGVEAWLGNECRGSLIYSSGTGKTEIAFECAKKASSLKWNGEERTAFNILLLVPRIVLVGQNCERLLKYGISSNKIGRYFGEQKEQREITISTYNSASHNLNIVQQADMIIFDEMHLAASHAPMFKRILEIVLKNPQKAVLGLTATIDESDPRNYTLLKALPPVSKYLIADAVSDGRLAKPVVIPMHVRLTEKEQQEYDACSEKIRNISRRFKKYDPQSMMGLLRTGGFPSWQAKAWFLNVKKRKSLLASADNKLATAVELIASKHRGQKVMVFSETLESVRKLRSLLKEAKIESMVIDSAMSSFKRQRALSEWGVKFYPLLSVHTLEIGYDMPEAAVEIILASTSNMNQVVQRIGRVIRKSEGKNFAAIYVIYASSTKDDNILTLFERAVESSKGTKTSTSA